MDSVQGGGKEDIHINKEYRVSIKERLISSREALQLTLIDDSVMGFVWNKYYRANCLKNIEFDKTLILCEDTHFNAIVLNAISNKNALNCIKVISEPLYCYMLNPSSVSHDENQFFDENDNLKYIVALKKIECDCNLDSKTQSYLKMRISCFAIDYFECNNIDRKKREKLRSELKNNFIHLIKNLFVYNWKVNIKRVCKGIMYLLFPMI